MPKSNRPPTSCSPRSELSRKHDQVGFDEDFAQALGEWRVRHRLEEGDPVLVLLELFRIHQRHWDELRRREMPSFEEFRSDIKRLSEESNNLRQQIANLTAALRTQRAHPESRRNGARTIAMLAALIALIAGYFMGRTWP